jgi:lipoprotein-anchoring transpeptidase ErfK/SrfK
VSLGQQWLWAYQNHTLLFDTAVTTGMPQLPTPDGTFQVQYHVANVMFYSPWPVGSPYYYAPEHVNYALYFANNGYYIHDAPWREVFGPGTNYPHTDPGGQQVTGSHGCVELPTPAEAWIYNWASNGATVVIYGTAPVPPPSPTPTLAPAATPTSPPAPTDTPTSPPVPTDTPTIPPVPTDTPTP